MLSNTTTMSLGMPFQVLSVEERMSLLGEAPLPSTAEAQQALAAAAALAHQQAQKQVRPCRAAERRCC